MRLAALSATATGVLLLGGCGGGDKVASAPPATVDVADAGAQTAPELLGAPSAPDASTAPDGLLGATTTPTEPAPITSAEIPAAAPVAAAPAPVMTTSDSLKTWRRPDGTLVTAMRPIANPKAPRPVRPAAATPSVSPAKTQPAAVPAKPATKLVAAAPPPKVVAAAPALKPVAPPKAPAALAKAPTPVIPAATPAAKPLTKLEALQAAVAPTATKDAVLSAGDSLATGQPGQVTLSLPATLGDMVKIQAAKLGLGKAAKTTSAYATLNGEGYEVTPNGRQTAVVKPGEATTFAWQVKPGADAKGQLQTQFGLELSGTKPTQTFSLGEIAKRVTPLPEKAKAAAGGLMSKLNLPDLNREVTLPGIGKTPLKGLLGGALVLLAVIILAILSRNAFASRARAEERRKFRTLTDYGRNALEPDDAPPSAGNVAFVSPMVAAAAGATAATAATAMASAQQDDATFIIDPAAAEQAIAPEPADPVMIEPTALPIASIVEVSPEVEASHAVEVSPAVAAEPVAAEPIAYVNPMIAATAPPALETPAEIPAVIEVSEFKVAEAGHDHDHEHKTEQDHGHVAEHEDEHEPAPVPAPAPAPAAERTLEPAH